LASDSNADVVRRYMAAHVAHDYDAVGSMRHAEWYEEWPQSGERVRGHGNDQAIMDNWPGGLPKAGEVRVVGSEDRWVLTPAWTIQRVIGSGDSFWVDGVANYPDGSKWFILALLELRGGKLVKETWYFGPPLEAPAWRAQWVERIEGGA
jgi:hypothetical protein